MLGQYFTFQGRATRYQFWMFVLVYFGAIIVASIIDSLLLSRVDLSNQANINPASLIPFVTLITVLAFFIPSLCISVRRLHDRDTYRRQRPGPHDHVGHGRDQQDAEPDQREPARSDRRGFHRASPRPRR